MKNLVYISGPITQGDQFSNVQKAIEAFNDLLSAGVYAFCPHFTAFAHMSYPRPHGEWMRLDVEAMLPRCNAVWRLPGVSAGADEECREARRLGIPVFDQFSQVIQWHQAREQSEDRLVITEGAT